MDINIAKVLRETGPIVTCVVLRAADGCAENDEKKPSASSSNNDGLVEEIQMDTTPKKQEVEKILGGSFTFVGQYEEEGIMLMAKRGCVFDEEEEEEDCDNLPKQNPHKLQPPFDKTKIYGDILVLKVAECDDPLDEAEGGTSTTTPDATTVATNDEFFLHYTKQEYLKFAARTDVVPPALPVEEEEEEEDLGEGEDEEENEWSGGEGEEGEDDEEEDIPEEEAQGAMMQLLLTTVLRKFQEENGRGPSTEELMVLKMTIAQKLGIATEIKQQSGEEGNEEEESSKEKGGVSQEDASKEEQSDQEKKRSVEEATPEACEEPKKKKVKFGIEESEKEAKAVLAQ